MDTLSNKIECTVNEILSVGANRNEVLLCESMTDSGFTNTQQHILMLLKKENITNKEIAKNLRISQAAVTKAMKQLIKENLIIAEKDTTDARILRYKLSEEALHIASEHEIHHSQTIDNYKSILENYNIEEREVIDRFLNDLLNKLKG